MKLSGIAGFPSTTMVNQLSEFKKKLPALVQIYPPKSKFSVDQIPDLTGRVVIVTGMCAFGCRRCRNGILIHATGGNTGLGYETVKVCLIHAIPLSELGLCNMVLLGTLAT